MLNVKFTAQFKKDYKLAAKRGWAVLPPEKSTVIRMNNIIG